VQAGTSVAGAGVAGVVRNAGAAAAAYLCAGEEVLAADVGTYLKVAEDAAQNHASADSRTSIGVVAGGGNTLKAVENSG
jgi:hypothetical protein